MWSKFITWNSQGIIVNTILEINTGNNARKEDKEIKHKNKFERGWDKNYHMKNTVKKKRTNQQRARETRIIIRGGKTRIKK